MKHWLFYVCLVSGYFIASLFRVSAGVAMPPLADSMNMSATAVGIISSLYFYAYTMPQPFTGNLCDDRGPLLSCGSGLILMSLGITMFALAPSPFLLGVGRFAGGLGAATTFTGILVYQANSFPRKYYSALAGISVTMGHFGGVVAVSPLGAALDTWGHLQTFGGLAFFAFLIGVTLLTFRKEDPVMRRKQFQTSDLPQAAPSFWYSSGAGFRIILSSRELKILTAVWSAALALQLTLTGLWGVPWLSSGCGFTVVQARGCMTIAGIGVMIGALTGGWVGTHFRGSRDALAFDCLGIAVCLALFLAGATFHAPFFFLATVSATMGFFLGSCNVLCNSNLNETVNRTVIGSAIGAINTIIFSSVVLVQFGSGLLLNRFKTETAGIYSSGGYLLTFLLILVLFCLLTLPLSTVKTFRSAASNEY